jgi:hypothetical protein
MPDTFQLLTPDRDIRLNAVLDYWTGVSDSYAKGYRRAAEVLLQRFLDDPDAKQGDLLVLPILFFFRHYLELCSKDIIVIRTSDRGSKRSMAIRTRFAEIVGRSEDTRRSRMNLSGQFEKVQTCIAEISALDPGSTSFRYPYDQHGRPVFGHLVVSLRHLQAAIADIGDFLDGVSIEMSVIWQDIPQPQTE